MQATTTDIERDLRNFIVEQFLGGDSSMLSAEGSLLGDTIDSMGVVTLVAFLQMHFGIKVEDDEVHPANLDTMTSLVEFVASKLRA